jgi:hypothetical protein
MVLREGSYASDVVKHCVRPSDLDGRSGVILFRKIHQHLLVEALEVEVDDVTDRFRRTELGFNVNSSVQSCMEAMINQVEVAASEFDQANKSTQAEQEYQLPLPGSKDVKEGEENFADDDISECDMGECQQLGILPETAQPENPNDAENGPEDCSQDPEADMASPGEQDIQDKDYVDVDSESDDSLSTSEQERADQEVEETHDSNW